jgi:hypothetical protein
MKKYLLFAWFCFFLIVHNRMEAQMRRVIRNNNGTEVSTLRLNTYSPNNTLSCLPDTILLTTQSQIDNFSTNYTGCTNPKYLLIDGSGASPAITNLNGLSSITEVINKLKISHTSITSLSALSNLTIIGEALELEHNPLITNTGLNNLTQLGSITFRDLPALNSVAGLSNHISSINGVFIDSTGLTTLSGLSGITHMLNLEIDHCPLPNLSSLTNLTYIQDWLWLSFDTLMTNVGLTNLVQCNFFIFYDLPLFTSMAGISHHLINTNVGTFIIQNTALTDLSGLDSLTSVPNFFVLGNPNMTSLHGLEKLSGNIPGGISIWGNPSLANIDALNNITSIDNGTLECSYNNDLPNLTGLANVTTIGGGLWIDHQPNLTSLGDLNSNLVIQNINDDQVRITNNNQLALCSFPPLCSYLAFGGGAVIEFNATGCNSIAEQQSSCPSINGTALTWTGIVDDQWITPGNWNPAVIPTSNDSIIIPGAVTNHPHLYSDVVIGQLTMKNGSQLYTNGFNFTGNGYVLMDNASITGGGNFTVNDAPFDSIQNCTIEANVNILNYTGNSYFYDNNISLGNLVLRDSTTQTGANGIDGNVINGDFTIIHNSDNDLYEGTGSLFSSTTFVQGNANFINNTISKTFHSAVDHGLNINGNFNYTGNGDGSVYNSSDLFGTGGTVGGNLSATQNYGSLRIGQCAVAGTVDINANATSEFNMHDVTNETAGGTIQAYAGNFVDFNSNDLKANITCTGITGMITFTNNHVSGNAVFADSAAALFTFSDCAYYQNVFSGDLSITKNATHNYLYENGNTISGNTFLTNNTPTLFLVNYATTTVSNYGSDLTIKGDASNMLFGNLNFNGTTNGHLKYLDSANGIMNIPFLKINKSAGSSLTLDQAITVTGNAAFNTGIIKTGSGKELIFKGNATVSGGNDSSYVEGPIKRNGGGGFRYVVGDSNRIAPVFVSPDNFDPGDTITVRYFRKNPVLSGYDTALHVAGIGSISTKEYWTVSRNATSTTNAQITLSYDNNRSGVLSQVADLKVAHWNGSQWQDEGNGGTTGNTISATVKTAGLVSFSPFTLAFKPSYIPVITVGNLSDTLCFGTFLQIPFTVDSSMFANNFYTAQISDSSGSFVSPNLLGYLSGTASGSVSAYLPQYLPAGNHYRIRITGSNPVDTSNAEGPIVIGHQPQNSFIVTGVAQVCPGNQTYADSSPEAGVTYIWTLSGGGTITPSGATAVVNWTTPGTYTVTLRTSTFCFTGETHSIQVDVVSPAPGLLPSINNSGRWLYASGAPPLTNYLWYRSGVLISGAVNASYYASLAGDYTIKYSNICGISPVSNTISFTGTSIAQTISFPAMPDKNYDAAPFIPNATATSGLPVSFSIVSGPATINTQTNLLTITGTGLITVKAYQPGNNIYDTAAPVLRSFTANKALQVITFVIGNQNFDNPVVNLSATSNSGLPITYSILSGPATVSGNTMTLTGIGTVAIRASQPGDTNWIAASPVDKNFCSSVVNLGPISGFSSSCPGTATYSVNNIPGATYLWRIAGGGTLPSTTNSANANLITPGVYSLLVSASGNCGAASTNDTLVVTVLNGIQPDSVQSMFPANGAINQQLPLSLSWLPAQPGNFYTFDLYVWRSDLPQPTTPFAANLTAVNYTIPLTSGLTYNQTYKWMVVSHNGSCAQINTGPIQQFSLIPLPDLIVSNVLAPATAFSGQSISISWTVSNPGPGRTTTSQNWTDAVFLSFDSIPNFTILPNTTPGSWTMLDFPVRPLLIGTRSNVSALDSGQQYSNSINFTLPVNYSQPLYAYVITNYPSGPNAPVQVTNNNDTARALHPIIVTLSPAPDVRVDTVFTPSVTFSGSTINVTYKVKNYGALTPAGSYWRDDIYISQSPLFDINTAIPIKGPKANGTYYANVQNAIAYNFSQLQADSVYTKNVEVVIPNYIFGTYFIYVVANATGLLYEGVSSNNNANRSQVQVFLTPTPHLTVSSLTLPVTTASTTQPIGVNWNIANTGFNDNIEKNKGHYFVFADFCLIYPDCSCNGQGQCVCPLPIPGFSVRDSVSFGSSYWIDRIYLSTDSTGLNTAQATFVGQTLQGQLNSGLMIDDNYTNPYAAGCKTLGFPANTFNANTFNVIKPGSNHPVSAGFTIPADLTPGNYYVYVLTNSTKTVYEYPGNPETKRSALAIFIQRPDLVVPDVTVPVTSIGGQPITINYSVLNNGPGAVFSHIRRDNIYVSLSPVFDGSAQLIASPFYTEELPVGTAASHTISYTFPVATSGTRYLYVHTNFDSTFSETNSNNNVSAGVFTLVSPATANDLTVSSTQLADTVFTIYATPFKYTVHNSGTGTTAGVWTDSIFISCSPTFNPATSYFIAKRLHSEIVPGGNNYTDSFTVNLNYGFDYINCFPQTSINSAWFFIKTNADHVVYEGSNGNNNIAGTGNRVLINTLVDHIVTKVTGPDSATVGRPYLISWTVKNIGYYPGHPNYYNFWADALYFATDSILTSNNAISASYNTEGTVLNTNQTYNDSKNTTTPNIPTGDYYVFVNTNNSNNIYGEKVLTNNTNLIRDGAGAAKKIHVLQPLLPDLTDSLLSAPSIAATGQPLTVHHRISNKGAGVTYPGNWSNNLWLSVDFIPGNAGDILLSAKNHTGALLPNESYDDSATATIALNVAPGNYVLISQPNATGNVFESNSDNNSAFKYITIYRPAPVDLVVENIMKPDTVFLGYTIDTAKWVILNNASNAASGYSSDGIYLSHSNVLDSTAVLLGIKTKSINMAPLSRDTISLQPLVNNITEGSYNVIVKTDLLNNIVESDKNNNTGIAVTQLYVKVKELPLNTITPNTIYNINRFYKLVIPDSLNGATIQVILKSADSLTMKNQLFIAKGYIPSAANFDYTYSTPNYGNQDIVMTSVTAGVYYITIRCVSANLLVQNITLKAVKLPFKILNVQSASGGNTGNVTIKISGSLFANNMTAKLSRPGTVINASTVYFSNSTIVYATFNLQGKPLGIYDVTLTKLDSTTAVLTNGFSVVSANNGGLITGGGINTGPGDGNEPGCDPGAASGLNSQLSIEVVAPEKVFAGWPFVIQVNYNNPTNVDIPAQVRILYNDKGVLMSLTPEGVANGTSSLYLELTEQNGPPGIIRAGASGTITVYAKAPLTLPAHTIVLFNLK